MSDEQAAAHEDEQFSLVFDHGDITLGEMEQIEEYMGVPYDEVFPTAEEDEGGEPRKMKFNAKQMLCVAFIAGRRQDPNFTWDQARSVKVKQLRSTPSDPKDEAPESSE